MMYGQKAPWGRRIAALLLDGIFLNLIGYLALIVFVWMSMRWYCCLACCCTMAYWKEAGCMLHWASQFAA